ncbi:hypothetical protein ACFXGA_14445 [Actinosynnema sp. NPDC059335]|uniref:hypothetical protein n=1 Tax=Actinosynnema sp. NPDC059335 TaxID=3346804 RepID=UPI00366BA488
MEALGVCDTARIGQNERGVETRNEMSGEAHNAVLAGTVERVEIGNHHYDRRSVVALTVVAVSLIAAIVLIVATTRQTMTHKVTTDGQQVLTTTSPPPTTSRVVSSTQGTATPEGRGSPIRLGVGYGIDVDVSTPKAHKVNELAEADDLRLISRFELWAPSGFLEVSWTNPEGLGAMRDMCTSDFYADGNHPSSPAKITANNQRLCFKTTDHKTFWLQVVNFNSHSSYVELVIEQF